MGSILNTLISVVMFTFESIDFKYLIAKEMRVRLMALSHIKDGANNT